VVATLFSTVKIRPAGIHSLFVIQLLRQFAAITENFQFLHQTFIRPSSDFLVTSTGCQSSSQVDRLLKGKG
jgi:hypothetical protein